MRSNKHKVAASRRRDNRKIVKLLVDNVILKNRKKVCNCIEQFEDYKEKRTDKKLYYRMYWRRKKIIEKYLNHYVFMFKVSAYDLLYKVHEMTSTYALVQNVDPSTLKYTSEVIRLEGKEFKYFLKRTTILDDLII